MGVIGSIISLLFGGGRNVVAQTAEVFRENAEAGAVRQSEERGAALNQFSAEFAIARNGWFDRMMDGVNRLPRPAMALGTIGLFSAAMVNPVWFAARMQGIALVPEPLWWLLGVIVSFYFGARHQFKGQIYRRTIEQAVAEAPKVVSRIEALEARGVSDARPPSDHSPSKSKPAAESNRALKAWGQHDR